MSVHPMTVLEARRATRRPARRSQHRRRTSTVLTSEPTEPLSPARAMVWGTIPALVMVFLLTGSLIWSVGGELVDGVAVGLFCAFWVGLGFGAIAGGVAAVVSAERHQAARERTAEGPLPAAERQDLAA